MDKIQWNSTLEGFFKSEEYEPRKEIGWRTNDYKSVDASTDWGQKRNSNKLRIEEVREGRRGEVGGVWEYNITAFFKSKKKNYAFLTDF